MKRLFLFLMICGFVVMMSLPVFAIEVDQDGFESLPISEDVEEISQMQSDILERVNRIVNVEHSGSQVQIDAEDLDWNRAYKLYLDANIYEQNTNQTDVILQMLDNQNYIWQLPISKENIHILVDISIGSPLTEQAKEVLTMEQQQQVINQSGKWGVSWVAIQEAMPSYKEQFLESLQSKELNGNSQKILLGGMSKMRSVVGISMNEQTMEYVIPIQQPLLTGTPQTKSEKSQLPELEQGQEYTFEQMAQVIAAVPKPTQNTEDPTYGGANMQTVETNYSIVVPIALFGLCLISIGIIYIVGKKRS